MDNNIDNSNDNVSLSGSVNGIYKPSVNRVSKNYKYNVILQLNKCTHRTSPKIVAELLENLFQKWPSKKGHWLYIAQVYPPRPIGRVIAKIIKEYQRGDRTIKNPAAYFTYLIKFRRKRKSFRVTNGASKQQLP
jgi:hypothetical protein